MLLTKLKTLTATLLMLSLLALPTTMLWAWGQAEPKGGEKFAANADKQTLGLANDVPIPLRKYPPKKARPNFANSIGMKFVWVPPGTFLMGSPKEEEGRGERGDDEALHQIALTKGFWMGVYTVTQQEYEIIMGTNPSFFSAAGEGSGRVAGLDTRLFPVESVTWNDAKEFCRKLGERDGRAYRLPTEAEWEYACRAGTKEAFHYGNSLSSRQANFNGKSPYGSAGEGPNLDRPSQVGSYELNAFGLHDMHGNVWQWCEDWYKNDYYNESPTWDPQGPAEGSVRVLRGGAWNDSARRCRSASRYDGTNRYSYRGFRVVTQLP